MILPENTQVNELYQEIVLPPSAINYLETKHLPHGLTLATRLLINLTLQQGIITTFIPKIEKSKLLIDLLANYEFSVNHLFPSKPSFEIITNQWLYPMVQNFLEQDERRLCVLEEHDAKLGDPVMMTCPNKFVTYKSDVYYVLYDSTLETVSTTFNWGTSWYFIAVLTSFPDDRFSKGLLTFTIDELDLLAMRTEKIIISAYDQESYLVWHKR